MSIEGIFLTSKASKPMTSIQEGMLVAGRGLDGDRYCNHTGSYSVLRKSKRSVGEREPGRQLTLLSAESVEAAFDRNNMKRPQSLGDLRRNIVIRGLSSEDLLGAIGHVVTLGSDCRVLVHRHTVPCMYNERKNGIPGMMEAIWMESGVSCEVLVGGMVHVGDCVSIDFQTKHDIDGGDQSPGYYIPPSQRTTAMVMESIERHREAKKKYLEIDPDGVTRLDESYATVGLTFWPRDKP